MFVTETVSLTMETEPVVEYHGFIEIGGFEGKFHSVDARFDLREVPEEHRLRVINEIYRGAVRIYVEPTMEEQVALRLMRGSLRKATVVPHSGWGLRALVRRVLELFK